MQDKLQDIPMTPCAKCQPSSYQKDVYCTGTKLYSSCRTKSWTMVWVFKPGL